MSKSTGKCEAAAAALRLCGADFETSSSGQQIRLWDGGDYIDY